MLLCGAPGFAQPAAQGSPKPGEPSADVQALITILENDQARQRLIDKLRATATEDHQASAEAAPETTIAQEVAAYTKDAAESASGLIKTTASLVERIAGVFSGGVSVDVQSLWNAVRNSALVVVLTFAVYFALRLAFRRFQRTIANAATRRGRFERLGFIGLSALVDALTVLAAWAIGSVSSLSAFVIDQAGQAEMNRALFLNAFLAIELIKVVGRTLFAPRWSALRIWTLSDTTAAYWFFWLSRFVSVVGYTMFFLAPIVAANVSDDAAQAVRVVVMFAALVLALIVILQNREPARRWLLRRSETRRTDILGRFLAGLARIWHVVAIGYLVLVFVLWLAAPATAMPFVLTATVQSLIAIAIGMLLTALVARVAGAGISLPTEVSERLPLLERRLNAFVPNVLRMVRVLVAAIVLLVIAQFWRAANVVGWLSSEVGQRFAVSIVSAILILVAGGLIYLAVQSWVEYRLNPNYGHVPSPRERTLLSLFRNAFVVALGVLIVMLVLSEFGVNIGPLLAGAGVVGLAVGFGAQKLVQDIITGAFIQFENAMNEGDVVTAGGVTGTVERLTIRSVSLRSLDGAYHLIPFSSVEAVTNFVKNFSYHVASIGVDYGASIPEVKQAMQDAFEKLKEAGFAGDIIGNLEMHGVTEFADSAVVVRARIKTRPGKHFALGRAYNEVIKEIFDERGIEIPFPHVQFYMGGEDKPGKSPPPRAQPRRPGPRPTTGKTGRGKAGRAAAAGAASTKSAKRRRKTRVTQDGPPDEGHDAPGQAEGS
ncbi:MULTISPECIES: mechanosensitive ion channel domain-containing protein [unclassified Mesorhizobium]|uniref:mechanosensitive ion channel domain-containing protein n=1 Tax=unclassified Mesorhizobium TaxID=325217 RepID=UPI001FEF32DA|nr:MULTISPECIES: mechanosensitive ion channel domain-containing protein [unclassified Mesorhizobium]